MIRTVIGDDDAVHAQVDRFLSVLQSKLKFRIAVEHTRQVADLWCQYSFQHDRSIPVIPDELEFIPTPKDARPSLAIPLASQKHGLLCGQIAISRPSSEVFLDVGEWWTFVTSFQSETSHKRWI